MQAKSADHLLEDQQSFLRVARGSLEVKLYDHLLRWFQGDLQTFIPHDVVVAAWGDFSLGLIHYDVISTTPGQKPAETAKYDISLPLRGLFNQWLAQGMTPYVANLRSDLWECVGKQGKQQLTPAPLVGMQSALVHGIRDQRGRHDCLYVVLHSRGIPGEAIGRLELLLPYIDTALRQIARVPEQLTGHSSPDEILDKRLTSREIEIMDWVRKGKTNHEIGLILDISEFTVKNHLQRIFRKLDVINRAQAVAAFSQSSRGTRG